MFETSVDDALVVALSKAKQESIIYHATVLIGNTDALKKHTGGLQLYK